MRLYQSLPQGYQKDIPRMLLTDTQVNNVAKAYINDENFGSWEMICLCGSSTTCSQVQIRVAI